MLLSMIVLLTSLSLAQSKDESEVLDFSDRVLEAVKRRDRSTLEEYFHPKFTHTHASGKVDEREARLTVLLRGEETIDSIKPESLTTMDFGDGLVIARGRSKTTGKEPQTYQWTRIYRKISGKWFLLATHVSLVVE